MDFKLSFALLLVLGLLGCMSMVAKADGRQPCRFIKVSQDGREACAKCCQDDGLIMGTTVDICRCITHFSN